MNILLHTEAEVKTFFGSGQVPDTGLLEMPLQGEHVRSWTSGDFKFKVGFFSDKARYVVATKVTNSKWEEADLRSFLMTIGDFDNWSSKPGSEFFDYREREDGKQDGKLIASATGWHTSRRRYAFVYVPVAQGGIALAPVKSSIDKKFPT